MLQYNSQLKKLVLPEYGRNVQQMVDYCLSIPDRQERTRCAFKHKLWDHLAIMSDFKLDIDYPYPVVKRENLVTKPERIPYRHFPIHYRHYGKITEDMLQKARLMSPGEERDALAYMLANFMKRSYIAWNKDNVEDEKIWQDVYEYTHGAIRMDAPLMRAKELKEDPAPQQQSRKKKKKNK